MRRYVFPVVFSFLAVFSWCTTDPLSSTRNSKPDLTTLSPTHFVEPSYGSNELTSLSNNLYLEFAAKLSASLKAEIDSYAKRGLSRGSAIADTTYLQSRVDTLLMIGLEAIMKRSISTALYAYLVALKIEQSASIYSKIGFCLNYLGRYAEARAMLLRARELEAEDAVIHANLAASYRGLGSLERAIYELGRAAELEPQNAQFKIALARLYIQTGKNQLARELLSQAKSLAPNHPEIAELMAKLPEPQHEEENYGSFNFNIDPFNQPSQLVTIADSIWLFASVIDSAVLNTLAEEGNISYNNDLNFSNRTYESNQICNGCQQGCGNDIGCQIKCMIQECERNKVILAECAALEKSLDPIIERKIRRAISTFKANAFGVVFRHPKAIDRDIAIDALFFHLKRAEEYISGSYSNTDSIIEDWSQLVAVVCEDANQQFNDFDWNEYYSNLIDIDACFFLFCVTITGSEITMSMNFGLIQSEMSVDMVSGDFGFGIGAGLQAGVFEAGAMFKIGTAGAQIKAGVSTAGPLKFKKEFSYQLVNF